jgi:hypothetical protein
LFQEQIESIGVPQTVKLSGISHSAVDRWSRNEFKRMYADTRTKVVDFLKLRRVLPKEYDLADELPAEAAARAKAFCRRWSPIENQPSRGAELVEKWARAKGPLADRIGRAFEEAVRHRLSPAEFRALDSWRDDEIEKAVERGLW